MFLENKYTKYYYSIIGKAQAQKTADDCYTEKHHIIPKSLGGSNRQENLVILSARQHFVCHLLLTKMVTGLHRRSMAWALHRMTFSKTKNTNRSFTSRQFEMARVRFACTIRGTKQTDETKKKIGDANRGWCSSEKLLSLKTLHDHNRGKKRTAESIEKQKTSIATSQKSKDHLDRLVEIHRGKKRSNETREKMAAARQRNIKLANMKKIEALWYTLR